MNANLKNCPECGRLFAYVGVNLCPRCIEEEEEQYQIVRRYVRDNIGANIWEVSEETGVEEERILRFLRDGRLQSKGLEMVLHCERCGKSIQSGRYCEQCILEMDSTLKGALGKSGTETVSSRETLRGREQMHSQFNKKR